MYILTHLEVTQHKEFDSRGTGIIVKQISCDAALMTGAFNDRQ